MYKHWSKERGPRRDIEYTELLGSRNTGPADPNSDGSSDSSSRLEDDDEDNPAKEHRYPWQVGFIIATEACERYSFYGLNSVLTLFLIEKLQQTMSENEAEDLSTVLFHLFKALSFITPLFGAALSDSAFGKFRTILYLSIVYAAGSVTLAFGAVSNTDQGIKNFPNIPVSGLGLLLIAIGNGGIKPCVVSLGADQFKLPEQKVDLTSFFAMFYAAINFGGLVSTIVTPFLRDVSCMGEESCFSLAFGVPGLLMISSVVLFYLGRRMYRVELPERNVLAEAAKCIWMALRNCDSRSGDNHWLEAASQSFDNSFIQDLKAVFRVGSIFLLYPMFWALYDQQGSRWTIQATKMNGEVFGLRILPDQMQVINPILILCMIPMFDQIIYPALGRVGLLRTPLQRIVTGCLMVVLAFLVSGCLELQLKTTYPMIPQENQARLTVHNGLGVPVKWSSASPLGDTLDIGETFSQNVNILGSDGMHLVGSYIDKVSGRHKPFNHSLQLQQKEVRSVLLVPEGVYESVHQGRLRKSENALPFLRFLVETPGSCLPATLSLKGVNNHTFNSQFMDTPPIKLHSLGNHMISLTCKNGSTLLQESLEIRVGGSYEMFVYGGGNHVVPYTLTPPNTVHIFWLLPQYFLITMGEILFSVTSLEFAYSQAPKSMKSIMQALYYLTTAVGNLITLLVVHILSIINIQQDTEFFMFAGLLFLVSVFLMIFTNQYTYVYFTDDDEDEECSERNKIAKD